jgi:hypothetical protein
MNTTISVSWDRNPLITVQPVWNEGHQKRRPLLNVTGHDSRFVSIQIGCQRDIYRSPLFLTLYELCIRILQTRQNVQLCNFIYIFITGLTTICLI